jgi:excisionase family DNA binding protein
VDPTEERLSLRDAADALGISEVTARRWVKSGKLKAYQPGRKYLIPASAVKELLEETEAPKASAPPSQLSLNNALAEAGRPSIIDVALDAARRQEALERRAMSGGRVGDEAQEIDQRHVNEAMRRLREEYALAGTDAEAVVDFTRRHVRLEREAARAREELQQQQAQRERGVAR